MTERLTSTRTSSTSRATCSGRTSHWPPTSPKPPRCSAGPFPARTLSAQDRESRWSERMSAGMSRESTDDDETVNEAHRNHRGCATTARPPMPPG
eukprot:2053202-Prymnesium_polylepis.1